MDFDNRTIGVTGRTTLGTGSTTAPRPHMRRPAACLALCAILSVAACGANEANGSQGEGGSDSVNWYTSMPADGAQGLAKAFTEKTGIKVNVQRIGSTELWQRFLTESNANKHIADVLSIASWSIVQDAKKQHLIQPFIPKLVDVGDAYSSIPVSVLPEGYACSSRLLVETIAYNTKLVPKSQVPTTWKDLLKPYWKGKIAMLDPKLDTGGYAAYHQMSKVPSIGWDFFNGLKAQEPIFLSGDSGALINQVISGKSQVAILQDVLAWEQDPKGAPVSVVYPDAGVGGTLDYNTLPSKPPHKQNALKLLKFLSSPAANDALVKSIFVYSPRKGAVVEPSERPKLAELHLLKFDPEAELADFKAFNSRFNTAIGR